MPAETPLRIAHYAPLAFMAPHSHAAASLNIVVVGDFVEHIGRAERMYAAGHAAFCPAGMVHSQVFGARGARQIIFRPRADWLDYLACEHARLDDSPHAQSHTLRTLGEKLLQEMECDDTYSQLAREGLMLEIVAAFGRDSADGSRTMRPPAWLGAVRDCLHAHAFENLGMTQIARVAGRHEVHVARAFRRCFGVSIGAYVRRLRTEHAARLLRAGRLTISEIAHTCGFASHSHLCREFKAHYSVTPSQYRRGSG